MPDETNIPEKHQPYEQTTLAPGGRSARRSLLALSTLCVLCGCASQRYENTAPYIERGIRSSHAGLAVMVLDDAVVIPAHDIVTFDWLDRLIQGNGAWNANQDLDDGTSFCGPRTDAELLPERVAAGPCTEPPPVLPFKIEKAKTKAEGDSLGFWGRDATGRKFLVKVDDPNFAELGSGASIVASRIFWACGYHVPAEYLVPRIEGTGDARFDGRRATAALFIPDVKGYFDFDWFRRRREVRALKIVAAWVNDTDRQSRNTLVTVQDGRAKYYQIDFNGALGSWQGWPKEAWRGYRYWGDPGWMLLSLISFGSLHAEPEGDGALVSRAVGRFDARFAPRTWCPQFPNSAFDRLDQQDGRWIAERIRRLGRPQIEAIVAAAQYSNPADAAYIVDTLMKRREIILREYSKGDP